MLIIGVCEHCFACWLFLVLRSQHCSFAPRGRAQSPSIDPNMCLSIARNYTYSSAALTGSYQYCFGFTEVRAELNGLFFVISIVNSSNTSPSYWDQRGAGRSFDPKADRHDLTIARHLADLNAIIDHLRSTLRPAKVLLVGHSWGAALSIFYAGAHPHKVSAVFAVNPLVSVREQRQAEYKFVLAEAARRHDDEVLHTAEKIGPPPYKDAGQVLALEKLSERYGGVFHTRPARVRIMLRAFVGGLVWPWEIARYIHANNESLQAMNEELLGLDLARSTPAIDVPVVFFLGRYDRHADARVAAAYFEMLRAPVKRLIYFENSAHNVPFEEARLFNATLAREFQSIMTSGSK